MQNKWTNKFVFFLGIFLLWSCNDSKKSLPFYGKHDPRITIDSNGNEVTDTVFYTVPRFRFTNQDNIRVSHENFEGKIYIADFFFTTCPTICPAKTYQLTTIQNRLKEANLFGSKVKIISHTVDVKHDTPEVLKQYSIDRNIDTANWDLVTGKQDYLYNIAEEGYLATAMIDDQSDGGFFHSDQFILIDTNKHIRGIYDGTDPEEVNQLWEDILILIDENDEK